MHAQVQESSWQASLGMRFTQRAGETLLVDRRHQGPLRIQRPFYPESRRICHVYLLHPPGGLVSGDRLEVDIKVDPGASGLVTTPGAGKVYRSNGHNPVAQKNCLSLDEQATLEWLPQETILFDGACGHFHTRVNLHPKAHFIGWEITCLGRPASGDWLRRCDVRQRFELWQADKPLWLERSRYTDESAVFSAAWGLSSHTVIGTLVCTQQDASLVASVRDQVSVSRDALFSVSQLHSVIVCRYLGHHAEQARNCLTAAWNILRPAVLGTKAVAPRIWNT